MLLCKCLKCLRVLNDFLLGELMFVSSWGIAGMMLCLLSEMFESLNEFCFDLW
jgi:hypothetical protein